MRCWVIVWAIHVHFIHFTYFIIVNTLKSKLRYLSITIATILLITSRAWNLRWLQLWLITAVFSDILFIRLGVLRIESVNLHLLASIIYTNLLIGWGFVCFLNIGEKSSFNLRLLYKLYFTILFHLLILNYLILVIVGVIVYTFVWNILVHIGVSLIILVKIGSFDRALKLSFLRKALKTLRLLMWSNIDSLLKHKSHLLHFIHLVELGRLLLSPNILLYDLSFIIFLSFVLR